MELMNIDTFYNNSIDKVENIYHYTSPEALISILRNKSIRFTNCLFLNDKEEFFYFEKLLNKLLGDSSLSDDLKTSIERLNKSLVDDNHDSFIARNVNGKKYSFQEGEYYIFSCSTDDDSLPMWNYYVKNSNYAGYSLKIDLEKMLKNFDNIVCECIIGNIVYEEKEQIEFIKKNLQEAIDSYNKAISELDQNDEDFCLNENSILCDYEQSIYDMAKYIRFFFKDNAFQHEKEYRIVLLTSDKNDGVKKEYNVKNGVITPCIEMKLDFIHNNPFKAIKVSPTMDFDLCKRGINDLIKSIGINEKELDVNASNIKIRY